MRWCTDGAPAVDPEEAWRGRSKRPVPVCGVLPIPKPKPAPVCAVAPLRCGEGERALQKPSTAAASNEKQQSINIFGLFCEWNGSEGEL